MSIRNQVMGAAGAASGPANYIEDVFSTYLYSGNDASQTITNGIDLSGKGGLVWTKSRSIAQNHYLKDTVAATGNYYLSTNTTAALDFSNINWSTSATGYSFNTGAAPVNYLNATYTSWTFRKQPKFFDVVTWTATGSETVSHNLQSVPGCVIYKSTSNTSNWFVVSRKSDGSYAYFYLNANFSAGSVASATAAGLTSTTFNPGQVYGTNSGETYVGYFFAHNAGGFGLTGTDNVISCGSYSGTGTAGNAVNLGFEPQFVIVKAVTDGSYMNWFMFDNMRGMPVGNGDPYLYANTSSAEAGAAAQYIDPTATGFNMMASNVINESGQTYIYIAIRRGPMKAPTDGTKVYAPVARAGVSGTNQITAGFPVDSVLFATRTNTYGKHLWHSRLRGPNQYLTTAGAYGEFDSSTYANIKMDNMTGITLSDTNGSWGGTSDINYINHFFRRAPSFFDEVCATGTSAANQRISHNLNVVPELIITKGRNRANAWPVYIGSINTRIYLNTNAASGTVANYWGTSAPTATDFGINSGSLDLDNFDGVFYLFATCPGVSKVGSYTGTGTTKQIACGFSAGARFVLIKRTDAAGDWYVWDSARGIVSGNDPYLLLNSIDTEATATDYIDPYAAGFELSSTAPAALNASGGTYIYLAIA